MSWIKLSEQKPAMQQLCIIWGKELWGDGMVVTYGQWDGYGVGDEDFTIAHGSYGTGIDATHWQPLPAPPA